MNMAIARKPRQRSIIQTIVMTSMANILIMAVTTLTSIITARMFGATGKGELAAVLFWPAFISGLAAFGLPTSLIYNVKKNSQQLPVYISMSFAVQIPISIIAGLISWFGIPVWLSGYSESVITIARWYTVSMVPVMLFMGVLAAAAQGTDKFHIYNLSRLLAPLLNLVGLVLLWIAQVLTVERAIMISLASTILVLTCYMIAMRQQIFSSVSKLVAQIRTGIHLFSYGLRVYGVELLGTLYSQFDKIIILALLTPKDFGLYSVVFALSRMFNVVQTAITNVIFPKVAGMEQQQVLSLVGRAFRISMVLMTIIIIPSMLIGRFFIGLLFGPEFLEASGVFYLLSLECIVGGGSWILASAFNALGRPGVIVLRQVIALAVTITLFFVLTPMFGLYGLGLALLLGSFVRMLMSLISVTIIFKMPMHKMLYNNEDMAFLKQKWREKNLIKGARRDVKRAKDSSHG
ncbi:O-antigen/teichoic acid export membrane protein [Paenibacillus sp. 4624]|uniref:Oligosaccharide flippase family protein n=2 Tax=Paenibacillus TaxID=44249 RepID=A0A5M9WP34_PAEAM|nr:oligosaccharide flippase family protein [Paenibacillus amylolyticus]